MLRDRVSKNSMLRGEIYIEPVDKFGEGVVRPALSPDARSKSCTVGLVGYRLTEMVGVGHCGGCDAFDAHEASSFLPESRTGFSQ